MNTAVELAHGRHSAGYTTPGTPHYYPRHRLGWPQPGATGIFRPLIVIRVEQR